MSNILIVDLSTLNKHKTQEESIKICMYHLLKQKALQYISTSHTPGRQKYNFRHLFFYVLPILINKNTKCLKQN